MADSPEVDLRRRVAIETDLGVTGHGSTSLADVRGLLAELDASRERIVQLEAEIRVAHAIIEEMAEDRHLLHGTVGNKFWICSRPCCKSSSAFLRGLKQPNCKAYMAGSAGGNYPAECDWPWCGCDPVADRVLAAIQEHGLKIVKDDSTDAAERIAALEQSLRWAMGELGSPRSAVSRWRCEHCDVAATRKPDHTDDCPWAVARRLVDGAP